MDPSLKLEVEEILQVRKREASRQVVIGGAHFRASFGKVILPLRKISQDKLEVKREVEENID